MRNVIAMLFVCLPSLAQSPTGQWISDTQWLDRHNWQRMVLTLSGDKLTGKYGNVDFDGTFRNGTIEATVKRGDQVTELHGRLEGDRIVGTGKATNGDNRTDLTWDARRLPAPAAPRTHTFEATVFQHYFSEQTEPVLHIAPGDTVKTWSVDAGGWDPKAVRRTSGGNPLTGPFYVDGAVPDDTLVIHFNRIRLNRNSAVSGDLIANSALNPATWHSASP